MTTKTEHLTAQIPFFDQVYRVEPGVILSLKGHRPTDAVDVDPSPGPHSRRSSR
jgi:hypothetical protein